MDWQVIDLEVREVRPLDEPTTIRQVERIVGIAIGRWLLSGLDAPDSDATDGITPFEAALLEENSLIGYTGPRVDANGNDEL